MPDEHAHHQCHGSAARPDGPASEPTTDPGAAVFVCPMHPEVREAEPGNCPVCGMALEPMLPSPTAKTEWTCPMHPEVVQDSPGSCPICGMALEPF